MANTGLTVRFTLRLPDNLLDWVRQQGGSRYVRELLCQQRSTGDMKPIPKGSLPPKEVLQNQWEDLTYERESLEEDRAMLQEEEKMIDRYRYKLDSERFLLSQRRELLGDEWYELEQARMELEEREERLRDSSKTDTDWPNRTIVPSYLTTELEDALV